MHLIVFGAPGSGKGTQARILSAKWNIPHVSTGDIIRSALNTNSSLRVHAEHTMRTGELIPDEVITEIIRELVHDEHYSSGFILDGFPRTVKQAQALEKMFEDLPGKKLTLLSFEADEDAMIERLLNRVSCHACKKTYHMSEVPTTNNCPGCGAENSLYKRSDDDATIVRNRLRIFKESTKPVLDYYRTHRRVLTVNALQNIDELAADIIRVCEEDLKYSN